MIRMKLSLKFVAKCSIRFPFNRTTNAGLIIAIVLISLAIKLLPVDF